MADKNAIFRSINLIFILVPELISLFAGSSIRHIQLFETSRRNKQTRADMFS